MDTLGRHVIAELDGCDVTVLGNPESIRRHLLEAARKAGAKVLADTVFDFKDGGVSGFVLLAESHISIHTWPEHRYAAVDIYTCGDHTVPEKGCTHLADALGASRTRVTSLERGLPDAGGGHDHQILTLDPGRPPWVSPATPLFIPFPRSA
jgi:S-adenosylmethionine decarboxylase